MTPLPVNERLLLALRREPVDRTPVWLMRQAGRYLPEYREVRSRAGSFLGLAQNPELACEVTLQPLRRFALDAAILFSDILTVPMAMGMELRFSEGEGPRFDRPLRGAADVARLHEPDPETELGYVMETIRLVRRELDGRVPLIGFAGSPWTLAAYMVEGRGSPTFSCAKGLLYGEPALAHRLLEALAAAVRAYLDAQIRAGAQAVMIFDTWGGVLSPQHFREFSLRYMAQILEGLDHSPRGVPVVLFTKGGGAWLEAMAETGCDALGVDWTTDLAEARRRVGARVALQGNLDPCALYAPAERLREEVSRVLAAYGEGEGHVFNLGHGVQPSVDPERVGTLVDAVHELSAPYHG